MSRQFMNTVRLGASQRAGWQLAALELWRLWQSRPKLKKRALVFLALAFVPLKLKLIAVGAAALAFLLLAGVFAALLFGLIQLV